MEMVLQGWGLALGALGALLAGISKGGFGSGVSFIAAALLALVIDPILALGVMLPVLMVIDLSALKPYWKKWDRPAARVLILGGLPGAALGAVTIALVPSDAIRVVIGLVALGFVGYQAARALGLIRLGARPSSRGFGLVMGCATGFTSFVSHAGGPMAAIYLLSQPDLAKTRYQATTVIVFWVLNVVKAVVYAGLGIFSAATLLASLALAPFAVLGTWIGVKAHHWVSERVFFALTYAALVVVGARLIWLGLG